MTDTCRPDLFVPMIMGTHGGREYAGVIIPVYTCSSCNAKMVRDPGAWSAPFDHWWLANLDSQRQRAGWHWLGSSDDNLCRDCLNAGKKNFACASCLTVQRTDQVKEQFGAYPTEYLCVTCYNTLTAAAWDDITTRLEEEHKYDFD